MTADLAMRADPEAEAQVLGALLLDAEAAAPARALLAPADFHVPAHGATFAAMTAVLGRGAPLDVVTLAAELRARDQLALVGGPQALGALTDAVVTTAHVEAHARLVAELARARRIGRAAQAVVARAQDPTTTPHDLACLAPRLIAEAARDEATDAGASMLEVALEFATWAEQVGQRVGLVGASTGLPSLDVVTAGLHPGQQVVIAGRPAMGKSAIGMGIAQAVARQGHHVAVFSLEMRRRALMMRLACAAARLDSTLLRQGLLSPHDLARLMAATNDLARLPITITDRAPLTVEQLRARCHALHARSPLGLVVVDYLQLLSPAHRGEHREREIAEISRALKLLAQELGVPVLTLSQLNRALESRQDRRPTLADLRESGAIENDADVVLFLYRECVYRKDADPTDAEVIVAKQREGPTGTVRLGFDAVDTRFYDPEATPRWTGEEVSDAAE